jgi:cellulose synthase/poly-beta-1,6-N-acetylglucosamine synthase-like glycosyltransferase
VPVAAAVCLLTAITWAYLAGFHGGYWRTDQRLPAQRDPAAWPAVTAVIPARDEAAVLPGTLPTLLAQDYPGTLRVVLVDDESSDGTAAVAAALGRAAPSLGQVSPGRPDAGGGLRPPAAGRVGGQGVGDAGGA